MNMNLLLANRYQLPDLDGDGVWIGQGGMGTVYKGLDTQTHTPVAIKQLKAEIVQQNPDMVRRFQLEGEALRKLNHPNIVKMLAAEQAPNCHYLVMEYVGGGSLRDHLDKEPQMSIQRVLYIALDLADALTRAHRLNILHRDIKPANVLIAEDGTPRLTDFGMARVGDVHVTQDGAIIGTLAYLSPEALNAEDVDERSDIWAFGVMLYEMLAGVRPFHYEQMGPLINAILTQPVTDLEEMRPGLPTALVDLVYRMLEKDRNRRIPSVRLVGAELEAIIRGTSTSMQPVVSADTSQRFAVTPTPTPSLTRPSQVLPPSHLPAQTTVFVGRDTELSELDALINDPDVRLLTLVGPGGIGKSRIAVALAERSLQQFPDGVFFVPLAPLDTPDTEMIASKIADTLGFTFGGGGSQVEQLANYLAEKSLLLILDNFEHLVDGAGLVADLLRSAPGIQMIVTSRERLRLRGEHIYEVQPMILPQGKTADEIAGYPSAQLFVQSARLVMPDFEVDEDNAVCIKHIAEAVQGLPLGIELAAGWLEMMDVHEIAGEIERSLDFLESDLRDIPERHRSLRAVFEYSWNLMSAEERAVFMKLSIFRGGVEREAAQQVTDASLRNLTSLVNKSLLRRDPEGRYQMPKTLRQYAEERFKAEYPDKDAVYEAHAMYYGEFVKKLQPALDSKNERAAMDLIDREFENLRVAWNWALKHEHWHALDMTIHPMLLFFLSRSMLREGDELFNELAETMQKKALADHSVYWKARLRQAWMAGRRGDYDTTWDYASAAYDYFVAHDVPQEAAYCLHNMSYACMMRGAYADSIAYANQAAEIARSINDYSLLFGALGNRGYTEFLNGNYPAARKTYEEANVFAKRDDTSGINLAFGLNNLGEIVREMGELAYARQLFEEAYGIFKSYRQRRGMAFSLNNIAGISFMMGDFADAQRMFSDAYAIYREIGDQAGIGHSLSALGNSAMFSDTPQEAQRYYEESLAIRRRIGDQRGIADSLVDLSRAKITLGSPEAAPPMLSEALAIRRRIGDRTGEGGDLSMLGLVSWVTKDYEASRQYLEQALVIGEETNHGFTMGMAWAGLGTYYLHRSDHATARRHLSQALQYGHEAEAMMIMLFALSSFADLLAQEGDSVLALEIATQVLQHRHSLFVTVGETATRVLEELSEALEPHVVAEAMERGKTRSLDEFVALLTT